MVADIGQSNPDEELDELLYNAVYEAINQMIVSSLDDLIKASGRAEALSTLKPYLKAGMYNQILNARKLMNIEGNGPDAILLTWKVCQSWLIPPKNIICEVTEKAGVEIVKECPCGKFSPDICIFFSHFGSEALCEFVNPEYECIITHHLTNGDPQCRLVFKKKSDSVSILKDPGRTLVTIPNFELANEQARGMFLGGGSACLHIMDSAFVDLHGSDEATSALSKSAKKIGRDMGIKLLEVNPKIGESIDSVVRLVDSLGKLIQQLGTCSKELSNMVEKEIISCSFQTWTKEVCYQYEALIQGILEAINPNFEFAYDRMMTKGDRKCHWTIKKKDLPKMTDDPLRALKMRYVSGEISEVEYRKIKKVLEE